MEYHAFMFDMDNTRGGNGQYVLCIWVLFLFIFNILSKFYQCFKVCKLYCKEKLSWQKIDVEHLSNSFLKVLRLTLGARCNKWQWCVKWDAFWGLTIHRFCEEVQPSKEFYTNVKNTLFILFHVKQRWLIYTTKHCMFESCIKKCSHR